MNIKNALDDLFFIIKKIIVLVLLFHILLIALGILEFDLARIGIVYFVVTILNSTHFDNLFRGIL